MGIGFYVMSSRGYLWVPAAEESVIKARDTVFEAENRKSTKVVHKSI